MCLYFLIYIYNYIYIYILCIYIYLYSVFLCIDISTYIICILFIYVYVYQSAGKIDQQTMHRFLPASGKLAGWFFSPAVSWKDRGHMWSYLWLERAKAHKYPNISMLLYIYIYSTIQPDFSAAISSGDAKQHPLGRVDSHKGPHGEAAIRATRKQGAGVCCAGWAAGKQLGNGLETMKEGDLDLLKAWKHHIYIYLGHIRNKQLDPAKWTAQQNVLQQWFQPRSERES